MVMPNRAGARAVASPAKKRTAQCCPLAAEFGSRDPCRNQPLSLSLWELRVNISDTHKVTLKKKDEPS